MAARRSRPERLHSCGGAAGASRTVGISPGAGGRTPGWVPAGGVEPSGRIPACGSGARLRLHQDGGQPARPRDRHGIGRAGAGPEVRPLDAELHRPEWLPVYGVDRHPDPHHQRRLAHRSPRARARVSNWPCRAACCGPRVGPWAVAGRCGVTPGGGHAGWASLRDQPGRQPRRDSATGISTRRGPPGVYGSGEANAAAASHQPSYAWWVVPWRPLAGAEDWAYAVVITVPTGEAAWPPWASRIRARNTATMGAPPPGAHSLGDDPTAGPAADIGAGYRPATAWPSGTAGHALQERPSRRGPPSARPRTRAWPEPDTLGRPAAGPDGAYPPITARRAPLGPCRTARA